MGGGGKSFSNILQTSMHSSRMYTDCQLTVSDPPPDPLHADPPSPPRYTPCEQNDRRL